MSSSLQPIEFSEGVPAPPLALPLPTTCVATNAFVINWGHFKYLKCHMQHHVMTFFRAARSLEEMVSVFLLVLLRYVCLYVGFK
jgi:hypothetical protein